MRPGQFFSEMFDLFQASKFTWILSTFGIPWGSIFDLFSNIFASFSDTFRHLDFVSIFWWIFHRFLHDFWWFVRLFFRPNSLNAIFVKCWFSFKKNHDFQGSTLSFFMFFWWFFYHFSTSNLYRFFMILDAISARFSIDFRPFVHHFGILSRCRFFHAFLMPF